MTAVAAPFESGDIDAVRSRAFHFGPLPRDDVPVSLIEAAADTGAYVAVGAQGFLRVVRNGEVSEAPWPGLREGLHYVDACQGDVEEICLLTEALREALLLVLLFHIFWVLHRLIPWNMIYFLSVS